jgi:PAS domain S-box-containing protein
MNDPVSIIVIDDDPGTCQTLGDVLELRGHTVQTVTRGQSALAVMVERAVNLAILDVQLPDISGLDLLRSIKASSPTTEVIVITGHASVPTAIEAINGTAFAYVIKPFEMDHLLAVIEKALEKQRLVRTLRESEERYRLVAEHIQDAILLLDLEGRIVLTNRRGEELTGYPAATLRNRPISSLLTREGAEEAASRIEAAKAGRDVTPFFEAEVLRRDGTRVWVEANVANVLKDGKVSGRLAVVRDITMRRQAEAALRETSQRLQAVVDAAPVAIIAADRAGRVVLWSRAATRLLGWTEGEVLGKVLPSILGILVDITERRQLEDQLRQAVKMEGIGRLAGGIAHDFNNLLTVIGGRTHILMNRLPADHPMRRDLELIQKTGERAAGLTRQLLAFSRKQILQPTVLDLNWVVSDVRSLLERLLGEDIELITKLSPGLSTILADHGQLEQVILNLAVNAKDAMPRGGRLTLETSEVTLDESYSRQHVDIPPGTYVALAVSDTGIGMDQATQARVFEPFFTTKEVGKGTGLGLATAYGIIKQSNGHIAVCSEPGIGTVFRIYLSRTAGTAGERAAKTRKEHDPIPLGTETVLLAEDDLALRALTRDILEMQGYAVVEATDVEDAQRVSERHEGIVHLLITDVVMPRMSGRALADAIRRQRPAIKVLFMSGYTDDAIVHHGVLDPGTAFLQKPFTPVTLGRKVREVLDQPS